MSGILGRKIGMTRVFDGRGNSVVVTIVEAGPCTVTQVKTTAKEGYQAVQLGFEEKKEKNSSRPMLGHFKVSGTTPKHVLREFRNFGAESEVKLGDEITVNLFQENEPVVVTGWSKGKGFQGVMKRHGFGGGPKTHGQSDRPRAPGSIGQASYPARVFKGIKMAGRTGGSKVTLKGRRIVQIIPERNILLIEGVLPGANFGLLVIQK